MSELLRDALTLSRNKAVGKEEYLIYTGEHTPSRFIVRESGIQLSDVSSEVSGVIHITLDGEGYLEFEVFTEGDFITMEKRVITSKDFDDGSMTLSYAIKPDKLHWGKNFGYIEFRNPYFTDRVYVTVNNHTGIGEHSSRSKQLLATLCRDYIELRAGRLLQDDWSRKTLHLLEHINGTDREDLYMMLYKASILISAGKYDEARHLIDFATSQINKMKGNTWPLRTYKFYVKSLLDRDDDETRMAAGKIKEIYESHPHWTMLWELIYMDEKLAVDSIRKLKNIRREFETRTMRSPILYYEAAECLREKPDQIGELDEFNLQVLAFAAEEGLLSMDCAFKIADLVAEMDYRELREKNILAVEKILKAGYKKFNSNMCLKSLVITLVCEKKKDSASHEIYEKAILEFLDIPGLYDYFLASATEVKKLPRSVLDSYIGREKNLGDNTEYFYASICRFKDDYGEFYGDYKDVMRAYGGEQLLKGRVTDHLAILYKDMLETKSLDRQQYQQMFEILFTKKVTCNNPRLISALVFHRELGEYSETYFEKGQGNIKVFSPDAEVLFKDRTGNLYKNVETEITDYMERGDWIDVCLEQGIISRYMLMGDSIQLLKIYRDPVEILEYFFRQMDTGQFRPSYEQELLRELITYFSKVSRDEDVSDKLLQFLKLELEPPIRGALIGVMIDRKFYREAYAQIEQFGYEGVPMEKITQLLHVLAEVTDYEGDAIMTEMCRDSFMNGGFDPVVFKYLRVNYEEDLDVLMKMYTASKVYHVDPTEVAGKVLEKMVEGDDLRTEAERVMATYWDGGTSLRLKKDFLSWAVERYAFKGDKRCEFVFPNMEDLIKDREPFSDRATVAFLLYMRKKTHMAPKTMKSIEIIIKDMCGRGILLEEFKDYKKFFPIPAVLVNGYVAESFLPLEEERQPQIRFALTERDGIRTGEENMRQVFPGCFIRKFDMFYGETLDYAIDGGDIIHVTYDDLQVVEDGSRFSKLNNVVKQLELADGQALADAAREYYICQTLIDKLF